MIDGRDRPGRRGELRAQPASTVSVQTERNCGRDVLDRAVERERKVPIAVLAELYGLSERAVHLIIARAKQKLASLPPELPAVDALLEEMGR